MHYPIKISNNENSGFLLEVPDLAGCQCISDTIEEGFREIKQAIISHLMILAEYGEIIPQASNIESLKIQSEDVIWGLLEIDITPYLGKSHKINVTLPELLIKQIDTQVSKSEEYKSRSGFIASACISELKKN